jgi:hypothetical protein
MSAEETSDEQIHGDEGYVAEQEAEAAREAAQIGGSPGGDYGVDESERALAEAGEGEAEGFELAEQELIENATHEADANPDPTHLQGVPESFDPGEGTFGEADDVEPEDQ